MRNHTPFTMQQVRGIVRLAHLPSSSSDASVCAWPLPADASGSEDSIRGFGRASASWEALARALTAVHLSVTAVAVHSSTHLDSVRHIASVSERLRDAWNRKAHAEAFKALRALGACSKKRRSARVLPILQLADGSIAQDAAAFGRR